MQRAETVVLKANLALVLLASLTACTLLSGSRLPAADSYFESETQKELVRAALRGNAKRVDAALADGADIDKIGDRGVTPLLLTIWRNQLTGMRLLLERGADPNLVSPRPENSQHDIHTPVQAALGKRSTEYLRVLLEHGADPDSRVAIRAYDMSALFAAIRKRNNLAFTRLLIEYGADVNHQASNGDSPILDAVVGSNYPQALLLLKAGADPNLQRSISRRSALSDVRDYHEREMAHLERDAYNKEGYLEFIEALKARGYLEEDF
jgi:ankyrin repeat protein